MNLENYIIIIDEIWNKHVYIYDMTLFVTSWSCDQIIKDLVYSNGCKHIAFTKHL
jgi:hypothetical protein